MTYREAVARLYSLERWGIKLGLDNIREFCSYLGNPQESFRTIHIAGTNGKGSVTALLDSVLRHAGYQVGRYTSPHLRDFRERIQVGGEPISRQRFIRFMERHWKKIHRERYSYFETATAMAYDAFARSHAQFGIIEVGLGGRFDATNTLDPALTVITHIHLDHERTLGKSIGKIAFEKAGIIKPGVPVIVGPLPAQAHAAVARIARQRAAPLFSAQEVLTSAQLPERDALRRIRWDLPLLGRHQTANLGVALAALHMLPRTDPSLYPGNLRSGVRQVHWPARFQVIPGNPTEVFDVAHNPSGMQVLADTWPKVFGRRKAAALFTTRQDKTYKTMFTALAPCLSAWVGCPLPHSPGIERHDMELLARRADIPFEWCDTPMAGYHRTRALAHPGGLCLVAGSHYLIGDVIPPSLVASPSLAKTPIQKLVWHDILASLRRPF
jgi:dihydrofolate synthase/folylpolyglutamate synthase